MQLKPEEISKVIRSQIKYYENAIRQDETGTVLMVGDGIARASGLSNCMAGELLEFEDGSYGMAQNLEENRDLQVLPERPDLSGMQVQVSQALLPQPQLLLIQVSQMPELTICTSTHPLEIRINVQLQVMLQMPNGFMLVISKVSRVIKVIQALPVMESPKLILHMHHPVQTHQRLHLDGRALRLP